MFRSTERPACKNVNSKTPLRTKRQQLAGNERENILMKYKENNEYATKFSAIITYIFHSSILYI